MTKFKQGDHVKVVSGYSNFDGSIRVQDIVKAGLLNSDLTGYIMNDPVDEPNNIQVAKTLEIVGRPGISNLGKWFPFIESDLELVTLTKVIEEVY